MLDDNVVNQTIPIILCAEEDVEGNHGATIGELDEQIMLYMQARGLSREQVYEEMSKARIKAVCNLIPDEDTKNMMSDYLEGEQLLENGGEQRMNKEQFRQQGIEIRKDFPLFNLLMLYILTMLQLHKSLNV